MSETFQSAFWRCLILASALIVGLYIGHALKKLQSDVDRAYHDTDFVHADSRTTIPEQSNDHEESDVFSFTHAKTLNSVSAAKSALNRAIINGKSSSVEVEALIRWAKENPAEALNFFVEETPIIGASRLRNSAFEVILSEIGARPLEERILEIENSGRRQAMLRNLFAALSGVDPRAAFAFARRNHTWADSISIQKALTLIARESPQEALQMSEWVPSREMRKDARLAIIDRWGNDDPHTVLQWIFNERSPQLRAIMRTRALKNLAVLDFDEAMRRTKALTDFSGKREAFRAIIKQQVMMDPNNLFQLIDDTGNAALRDSIAGMMIEQLSLSGEVINDMLQRYDLRVSGADAAEAFIQREIFRDPHGTLAFIESLPKAAQEAQKANWFIEISKVDPVLGAQKMAGLEISDQFGGAIKQLASKYALYAPAEALVWADQLQHSNLAKSARYFTLSRWAEIAPEAAAANIRSIDKAGQPHAISYVGQAWAQSNPVNAMEWIQQVGQGKEIAAALGETIAVSAQQDFEFARDQFAALSITEPELLNTPAALHAANAIGQAWEGNRFNEGAEWLDSLPEGDIRKQGALGLVRPFAEQNPLQLYEEFQTVEQADLRDAGLLLVAQQLNSSDLESAYNIAFQLTDSSYRNHLLKVTLSSMDRERAQLILNQEERFQADERAKLETFLFGNF